MVSRSSGVPQRGHTRPRPRAGMKRPVWTPPLRIASRVAARSARRSTSSSWTDSPPATPRGESRAPHRLRGGGARPPRLLVGGGVADAGDPALVEQARLARVPAAADPVAEDV